MTADLEAGQELNERVARIMRWRQNEYGIWILPDKSVWLDASKEFVADLPDFSGSPEGAAIVKNWLREQGISYRLWCVADEPKGYKQSRCERIRSEDHTTTVAPEEPLAVCRFVVALSEEGVV